MVDPKIDFVNRIANGEAQLLTIKEIVKRLGTSRSSFDRWVASGKFPAPDICIGKSARWEFETFRKWVAEHCVPS
jgi:excisionase family DNA binding protein